MTANITFFDATAPHLPAAEVEFFDAPMCCSSGLCGPTPDQALLDVNEMALKLKAAGLTLERYQMSSAPNAFMSNPAVMRLVRERQMDALPITVVRGQVIKVGAYPTWDELQTALNPEKIS